MNIVIDACEFNTIEEFHELIKEKMNFPEDYNDTLDDLWDCLVHKVNQPVNLYWLDFETSRDLLGSDADDLLELFTEADEEIEDFHFELQENF